MKITQQRQMFCEGRAQGMTGEEAVAHAGYKSRGKAARVQSARLLANDSIIELIDQLRAKSRSESVLTAQQVKEGLSRLLNSAEANEDYSGYTQLANRLAKMDGHDEPERHKMEFDVVIGGTNEDSES